MIDHVLIYHLASAADWAAAQESGTYTTSTRGRSLAEEGFIHASRLDQWRSVHARYYGEVAEPLVLLEIDTDRLAVPVVEERAAPGATETFPHVYGPINPGAVRRAVPLPEALAATSFSALFLREVLRNAVLGLGLVTASAAGALLVAGPEGGSEALLGAGAGLAVGVLAAWLLVRRGRRRR